MQLEEQRDKQAAQTHSKDASPRASTGPVQPQAPARALKSQQHDRDASDLLRLEAEYANIEAALNPHGRAQVRLDTGQNL